MDLLKGCDDQYFDYNVDELDMVLYGATLILEQEDINLRTLRIKELEISFTVTRRTKSEYLKSLDFWYNPLTNYKEYQIPLQKRK